MTYTIIDSHCHIYPEKIAARATAGTGNFYEFTAAGDGTLTGLLNSGQAVGISHFVVQSVATTPHQVRSINEFIAREVAENPTQLTGLGTLHPDSGDIAADLAHLQELGLKGVKLHADIQHFCIDDSRCMTIYELCEREGLPILMHTGDSRFDYSNPDRLLPVLQRFPRLTIIGAHLGGWSVWDEAAEKLAAYPQLLVDCSSSMPFLPPEKALAIIRYYGAERVLFGSDFPMFLPKKELPALLKLGLTDEELRLILHDNAAKLYGITI